MEEQIQELELFLVHQKKFTIIIMKEPVHQEYV